MKLIRVYFWEKKPRLFEIKRAPCTYRLKMAATSDPPSTWLVFPLKAKRSHTRTESASNRRDFLLRPGTGRAAIGFYYLHF